MISLSAIYWILTSHTILEATVLLVFVFSIFFRLIRG